MRVAIIRGGLAESWTALGRRARAVRLRKAWQDGPGQRHFSRRALPITLDEGGWPCLGFLAVLRLSCHGFSLLLSFYVDDCMSYCPMQSAWQRKGYELVCACVRVEDPAPLQLYIACINRRFTHGAFAGRRSPGMCTAWTIYVLMRATGFAVARCE